MAFEKQINAIMSLRPNEKFISIAYHYSLATKSKFGMTFFSKRFIKKKIDNLLRLVFITPFSFLSENNRGFFYSSAVIGLGLIILYLISLSYEVIKENEKLNARTDVMEKKLEKLSVENRILKEQLDNVDEEISKNKRSF